MLDNIIPPEIKNDRFYDAIIRFAEQETVRTVLEIGSSAGNGSTEAFVKGLKRNTKNPSLYCLEISKPRFSELLKRYASEEFVKCYNLSSVALDKFPTEDDIKEFYINTHTTLNNYPLAKILNWYRQDKEYIKNNGIFGDGIRFIKKENDIDTFDMVLIDGSEFTGKAELDEIYGARLILLDDINAFKNFENYNRLLYDSNYVLVEEDRSVRNGYAIFKKTVTIHFFTIVLNGHPFIRYHIDLFKQLKTNWHWHIVEGVADLKHDTSWSLSTGGKISDEFHRDGLSMDGTSEYIDRLKEKHPEKVTIYRKKDGSFWDGKLEMVNAPLINIQNQCLLWQIDSDELWTLEQIQGMLQLFEKHPEKSAAFFHCHFFVGPDLLTLTPEAYSHHNSYEWLRVWNFRPGMRWVSHEPPLLAELHDNRWHDVAKLNPFSQNDTAKKNLVFTHYAYALESQVKFKEVYYGYKGAVRQWQILQQAKQFPVYLRNYFSWVKDAAQVARVDQRRIGKHVKPVEWDFKQSADQALECIDNNRPIIIDGVIFQLQHKRPLGISRVWLNLIPEIMKHSSDRSVVFLRRGKYSPNISGLVEKEVPLYQFGSDKKLDADDAMLEKICSKLEAGVFLSTYYTRAPGVFNILMLHDMIPEIVGIDMTQPEWRSKVRAIEHANAYIAISQNTRNEFFRIYENIPREAVTVSCNGVSPEFYPAEKKEIVQFRNRHHLEKPYYLLVGNRQYYKNGESFFKTFTAMQGKSELQVLAVGGEPHLKQQEESLIENINIKFIPWLDNMDLRAAYSGALALVYLSSYEGFGLPILEAMACGCPVITTRLSAIPEVGGNAVLYVDPNNFEEILAALHNVRKPEFCSPYKNAGIERAKKFSWRKTAEGVFSVIASKISERPVQDYKPMDVKKNTKKLSSQISSVPQTSEKPDKYVVSAIVSSYNAERFIRGCLEDLEKQTIAERLEIIVVNSGSNENEEAIVKEFQKKYENIKYIKSDNRETVYAAWNRGIKSANGKYITNANTDDRHRKDALEVMVNMMETLPEIALVYADVYITENENENFEKCTPVACFRWMNWNRDDLLNKGCFVGPQPMWRRDLHLEYGYFDESFVTSGDYEFWLRISQNHNFLHIPVILGLYLRSANSIEHTNRKRQAIENERILRMYNNANKTGKILRKNWDNDQYKKYSCKDSLQTQGKQDIPLSLYTEIMTEISIDRPEATIKKLEKLLKKFPDYALAHNDIGVLHFRNGDKKRALYHYRKTVKIQPENNIFRKNLADLLSVTFGEYEEALQHYVTVLASDPKDIEALLATGHICARLERYDDAAEFYERVLEIVPNNSDAQNWLAKMQEKKSTNSLEGDLNYCYLTLLSEIDHEDLAGAIQKIKNFIEMYPNHGQAHNDLGVLYYKNESKAKVLAHYLKAVELEPEIVTFRKNLADFLYVEEGRVEEALENYVEVLRIKPDDVETLLITGHICAAIERFDDAMSFYHKVLNLEPTNLDARQNMEALNKRQKSMLNQTAMDEEKKDEDTEINQAEPQASVDEAPNVQDGVIEELINNAEILFQQERIDRAVDTMLKAIAVSPSDGRTYVELAGKLVNYGRHENALEVLAEMPTNQPVAVAMQKLLVEGYAEEGMGNYTAAKKCSDGVLAREPKNAKALNLNGILAYRKGDKETAEQHFKRAIELDSEYGEPHTNLGALVWETNEPKLAMLHYEHGFSLSATEIDVANAYHEAVTATGEYESAEKVARSALKKYPQCRKVFYLLVDTLIRQEKNEAALKELEIALSTFGVDEGLLDTALTFRERVVNFKKAGSSKKPNVSLCMIVKDEEANLARCLASVKPIVDEMIVVDTGSTDRTRDIAEFFGARVYDFEWNGDFAEARNFSLSKAKGGWVLILDADEVISSKDYAKFRSLVRRRPKKPVAYSITTRNYCTLANNIGWETNIGEYPVEEAGFGWLPSTKVRLFYGKSRIRFEGAVHEMVDPVLKRAGIQVKSCKIPVHHYGRLDTERMDRKGKIYYDIGCRKLEESNFDHAALRELATQATILCKNEEAVDLWHRFLKMSPPERAVAEAHINLATLYLRMQDYGAARNVSEKVLSRLPEIKEARYNLALSELYLGGAEKTVDVLKRLVEDHPLYPPAQFILTATCFIIGQKEEAKGLLENLKKGPFGPVLTRSFAELVRDLTAASRFDYAQQLLDAALENEIVDAQILAQLSPTLQSIPQAVAVTR